VGSAERKEREVEEFKASGIEAATAIISDEGYDRLSIRSIAEKIEYSPAIIYHYFKDKGDIVARIVEAGYRRIVDSVKGAPVYADDPLRTLREAFASYSRIVLESPNLFRIALLGQGWDLPEDLRILTDRVSEKRESIRRLTGLVRGFGESGKFRSLDPETIAQVILSTVHGLLARFILEPEVPSERREELLRALIEVLVLGLGNGGARRPAAPEMSSRVRIMYQDCKEPK